ncbi:MAG: HAMP domain-containing histidine kinase [Cyanothece sp. SIO1E1]|nr:HAMP domain-containing histidine kinase [Cyanothece sp. SIO1E1]
MADIKENSASIQRHGQRAASIVSNMTQYTNAGQGYPQPTDLNGLVAEALRLSCHSIRAREQGFSVAIDTEYDASMGQVDLVASDMSRALINIIENAYYALHAKHAKLNQTFVPTLEVKTQRKNSSVEICIRDNGFGITPEIEEKIFSPFFTTKPPGEGTGLGLSLAHDIVVGQHQGTLSVEVDLGSYTEFIITLPSKNQAGASV